MAVQLFSTKEPLENTALAAFRLPLYAVSPFSLVVRTDVD